MSTVDHNTLDSKVNCRNNFKKSAYWEKRSQTVPNSLIYHRHLTDFGKILLMALNALPEVWKIYQSDIAERLGWGDEKMRSALKSCVKNGYMKITQSRGEKGKFIHHEYEFDLEPIYLKECLPDGTCPDAACPDPGNRELLSPLRTLPSIEDLLTTAPEDTPPPDPGDLIDPGAVKLVSPLYGSLEKLTLDEWVPRYVCKNYSVQEVDRAVKRVLEWIGRESDSAALLTTLKHADTWVDRPTKQDTENNNAEYLKSIECLDGKMIGPTIITVGYNYVEFCSGPKLERFETSLPTMSALVMNKLAELKERYPNPGWQ